MLYADITSPVKIYLTYHLFEKHGIHVTNPDHENIYDRANHDAVSELMQQID